MVTTRGGKNAPKPTHRQADTIIVKSKAKLLAKSSLPARTIVQKRRKQSARAPDLGNQFIFIFVGPTQDLITLHTDILPQATQVYINNASAGLPTFQLPNEDPTIFHIYRSWLYSGSLYTIAANDQEIHRRGRDTVKIDGEWTRLAHCYILGINIQDERFANAAVSALVEKMTAIDHYPTGIAAEVYHYTEADAKLRKLIVDIHVWRGLGQWIKAPHDDAEGPAEFLRDVVTGMAEAGGELYDDECELPWDEDLCGKYHTHAWSEKCEA